ncbi:MAG: hypothetical protein EPN74_05165 [Rhodanobacter sp.]|nr:MAG: hypothetical protein EPN74_05165 [Rhodanobacter sp.]
MTAATRSRTSSRRPRTLVRLLAWVMLVVTALTVASPGVAHGLDLHAAQPTTASAHHATQAVLAQQIHHPAHVDAGCCGGPAGQHCSCAVVCGTGLPVSDAFAVAYSMNTSHWAPSLVDAPSQQAATPFRPPVV